MSSPYDLLIEPLALGGWMIENAKRYRFKRLRAQEVLLTVESQEIEKEQRLNGDESDAQSGLKQAGEQKYHHDTYGVQG